VLSNPPGTGAVVGVRRPGRMLGLGGEGDFRLSPMEEIEDRSMEQAA
jgi:hypothetical protein